MTTLVYNKDVIAADSLQFIHSSYNALPIRGKKVFLSKNKKFGYGIVGMYFLEKETDNLEKWLEEQINNKLNNLPIINFESENVKWDDCTIVVMTSDYVFLFNKLHNNPFTVTIIDNNDYYVGGTGGNAAATEILLGASAVEAVEEGMFLDVASGCDIYAVKRSSLINWSDDNATI